MINADGPSSTSRATTPNHYSSPSASTQAKSATHFPYPIPPSPRKDHVRLWSSGRVEQHARRSPRMHKPNSQRSDLYSFRPHNSRAPIAIRQSRKPPIPRYGTKRRQAPTYDILYAPASAAAAAASDLPLPITTSPRSRHKTNNMKGTNTKISRTITHSTYASPGQIKLQTAAGVSIPIYQSICLFGFRPATEGLMAQILLRVVGASCTMRETLSNKLKTQNQTKPGHVPRTQV